MMLAIRMVLYFVGALLAGQGLAVYDPDAGTITFEVESLALAIGGTLTFAATFVVSRFSRQR